MSVYRVEGHTDATAHLRYLVANQSCSAICESGYRGITGELWFTRVLPPVLAGQSEHVVFTSPYVFVAPEPAWTQYFDRTAAQNPSRARIEALERNLKWGLSRRYWPEFVFEGYVTHQPGAIFLKGLPDVPDSWPIQGSMYAMPMDIDEDKIGQAVLALLSFGLRLGGDEQVASMGYTSDPARKAKSVLFTEEGLQESGRLFDAMFRR